MEQVDDIFGANIARGGFSVGTAPYSGHWTIYNSDTILQSHEQVGDGSIESVVEVSSQFRPVEILESVDHRLCLLRRSDPDGVSQRYLIAAQLEQLSSDKGHDLRVHFAIVGATQYSGDVAADLYPILTGSRAHFFESIEALLLVSGVEYNH